MAWSYAVLIRISSGYPPEKGRLHTRYAPVRRSLGSKLPIPLDLHVLGLPLAFILSQDQTLHCKMCCSNTDYLLTKIDCLFLIVLSVRTDLKKTVRLYVLYSKHFRLAALL